MRGFILGLFFFLYVGNNLQAQCLCQGEVLGDRLPLVEKPLMQEEPEIAVDSSSGNYFVIWENKDKRSSGGSGDIHSLQGQLFDSRGNVLAPPVVFDRVYNGFSSVHTVVVLYHPQRKQFFAVWRTFIKDNSLQVISDETRGQYISKEGTLIAFPVTLDKGPHSPEAFRYSAALNQFLLFYTNYLDSPGRLFVRRLTADGKPAGFPVALNSGSALIQYVNTSFDVKHNRYLVAWWSDYDEGIHFQILGANLQKIGANHTIPITEPLFRPELVYDAAHARFVYFWNSYSGFLRGRTIQFDGTVGPLVLEAKLSLVAARYNPFTRGYLLLVRSEYYLHPLRLVRLGEDFTIRLMNIPVSCQSKPSAIGDIHLIYNPVMKEFLATWIYNNRGPEAFDIYAQPIRAVSLSGCN